MATYGPWDYYLKEVYARQLWEPECLGLALGFGFAAGGHVGCLAHSANLLLDLVPEL